MVEYAELLKSYGVSSVTSVRYAGSWVAEAFRTHDVACNQTAPPKSELYVALLPKLTMEGGSRRARSPRRTRPQIEVVTRR